MVKLFFNYSQVGNFGVKQEPNNIETKRYEYITLLKV